MTPPAWFAVLSFFAFLLAAGLAWWGFTRRQGASLSHSLALLLAATSLVQFADGLGLLDAAHEILWRRLALAAELLQPAALFYAGIQFLSPAQRKAHSSRLWAARIMGMAGLLLAALVLTDRAEVWTTLEDGASAIGLAVWGRGCYVFLVLATALGLAQLEVVLRASSEPVRYRLKLIVIGMGGLSGYQIYHASQMLLLPTWRPDEIFISSVVTMISLSVLALGILRSRFQVLLVNAYVSQQALVGSVTFIVVGFYLLMIGFVGAWLRRMNQPWGAEFSVVIVFVSIIGLMVAAFSKTIRAEVRRFLSRNFYRSRYDYRAEWLRVTEAFQLTTNKEMILDHLLDILITTFPTTTIAIWVFREADRRFCQARPHVTEKDLLELTHPVVRELLEKDEPVMVRGRNSGSASVEDPLIRVGAELCFPIRAQGQLVAFIVLGKQPSGEAYGTDDCDLLHGMCHHVGALLSHANLAEERQAAAELEALHRFSVFCLHDLKNLGSRLSLVAQNAEQHGRDPAFQEAALRTVADTAKKMTSLMSKLSLKSFNSDPAGESDAVDILPLIEEIVAPIREDPIVSVQVTGGPLPPVMGVREQIHQVLLNIVLNARQAIRQHGKISIAVDQLNESAIIRVEDSGCGIPPHMLATLFGPSQSSRPGGLGIGLYQCKKIVEAHGGTIEIRSEEGKGTCVRIVLPLYISGEQGRVPRH